MVEYNLVDTVLLGYLFVEGEVIPMTFEKISIREILALVMLGIVNIMAVLYGWPELAMSISSGLVGYLGGRDMRHDRNQ